MSQFVSLFVSGGVSGAVYSLLAIGLVLSTATSRIFNFGHAATAFATAYVYYQLNSALHWSVVPAFVVSVCVFAPLTGLAWDRLVFRRLAGADETAKMVAGIGVLIVMPALVQWVFDILRTHTSIGFQDTSEVYTVPALGPNPPKNWHLTSSLLISSTEVIILGAGAVSFVGLWLLLRYTALGLKLRVTVDGLDLARLRGINPDRVSSLAWLISFFMAGLAGVLAAPLTGTFGLVPDNWTSALFIAATAAIIGNMRSIPIAFMAGILLGAGRDLIQGYILDLGAVGRAINGVSGLVSSFPYLVLFVALYVLGRDRRRTAGVSTITAPRPDYLADLPQWRRATPWVVASVVLLVVGLGPASTIWRELIISGLCTGVIFLSFTVLTGLGGMVSLAQGTFATIAPLVDGLLLARGWPFVPALIVGVASAGVLGLIVAIPALRLGGLSLTLSTLALALLGGGVLFLIPGLTNSGQGWTIPRPPGLHDDRAMLAVLFALLLLLGWLVRNLQRSATGRAIVAVRTAESAAAACGVSPAVIKLSVFGLSAVMAGLGGILYSSVYEQITPTLIPVDVGFLWLATVVIFGVARPAGAVVAGLVSVITPEIIAQGVHIGHVGWSGTGFGGYSAALIPQILFGGAAIGLAQHPHGALSQFAERNYHRRMRRALPAVSPTIQVREPTRTPSLNGVLNAHAGGRAAGPPPTLELVGVRAGHGAANVLHDIDLAVEPGVILAMLGANGAGKSTLCGVLAGLVPVSAGHVLLNGEDITTMPAHRRANLGVLLLPESRGIFPSVSVEDNLSVRLRRRSERDVVYDRFPNLAKRRSVLAGNLSGGEQQMLSLGPMFVSPPALLIADEPTLGLSPTVGNVVVAALAEIQAQGSTVLLVEEKTTYALRLANEVGLLSQGMLRWVRKAGDVGAEEVAAAYLGVTAS